MIFKTFSFNNMSLLMQFEKNVNSLITHLVVSHAT